MSKDKNKEAACPETQAGEQDVPETPETEAPLEEAAPETPETEETAPSECEALQKQVEALTAQNAELNDRLLRTAAEYDNFRKRTQKEKGELSSFTKAGCLKEILGVADNFERALSCECKDPDFKKGMDMIFTQLHTCLEKLGAKEIPALNEKFDPELHNAIKQVEDENFGENTVCEVLQKGYRLEDRIIRHAMVVVANP